MTAPNTFIARWNSDVIRTLRPDRLISHVMINDRAMKSTNHGQNGIAAIAIRPSLKKRWAADGGHPDPSGGARAIARLVPGDRGQRDSHAAHQRAVYRQLPRRDIWLGPRSEEHTSELQSLRHLVC